jgi:hypothetical protein
MPQYDDNSAINNDSPEKWIPHFKEYKIFLEGQIPQLFFGEGYDIYITLLYDAFFNDDFASKYVLGVQYNDDFDEKYSFGHGFRYVDKVTSSSVNFIRNYLSEKLEVAINRNNSNYITDVYNLIAYRNESHIRWAESGEPLQRCDPSAIRWITQDKYTKELMDRLQWRASSALTIIYHGEDVGKMQEEINDREKGFDFLSLLFHIKCKGDGEGPLLSFEEFVVKYIPTVLFDKVLSFPLFQEQNEEVYQNMIQKNPDLSREDTLRERLLPCFATIAINNANEMLNRIVRYGPNGVGMNQELWEQVDLGVLNVLCKRQETEPGLFSWIVEMVFKNLYNVSATHNVLKKYPHVLKQILEYSYNVIKNLWVVPVLSPVSLRPIEVGAVAFIIGTHKDVWSGFKQLLIALRKSRRNWVDDGLNCNTNLLPNGEYNLVWTIKWDYIKFFSQSLKELRQEMTNGLGDWLKPLPESKRADLDKRLADYPTLEKGREGFDITYTEPDPIWRYAYVRAIGDLGVDVDGKGHYIHSILDRVAREDPSEMVRDAAAKVSTELKNLRNGWDGGADIRKLDLAFWWLKQASRLALNLPVDRNNALRIRAVRREGTFLESQRLFGGKKLVERTMILAKDIE